MQETFSGQLLGLNYEFLFYAYFHGKYQKYSLKARTIIEWQILTCKNSFFGDQMVDENSDFDSSCKPESKSDDALMQLSGTQKPLPNREQFSCKEEESMSFDLTDICVFKLDDFNHLTPCRYGAHLQNCQEFECNNRIGLYTY